MVDKSQRLQPVIRVADDRERKAAQAFGEARQVAANQEGRLNDLKTYRQEYISRFESLGRAGLTGAQIRDYQRFLEQLDRAIQQQEQAVSQARSQVEDSKASWVNKNTKATAIRNVADRFRRSEEQQAARADQKETDNRRPGNFGKLTE